LALYLSRVRSSELLGAVRAVTNFIRTCETEHIPPRTIIASPIFDLEPTSSVLLDRASPKLLSWQIEFRNPHFPFARKRAKQVARSGLPDAPTSDASNDKELREIEHCRVT
jgi:alpha-beta hydrolase superfamily lysophospholipase